MLKVTGVAELAEMVEHEERIKKAEKEIRKMRIKELVNQGVDRKIAAVMVDSFIRCGM